MNHPWKLLFVVAFLALSSPAVAQEFVDDAGAHAATWVDEWCADHHIDANLVGRDQIVAAASKARTGIKREFLEQWLLANVSMNFYSFAPTGGLHNSFQLYRLPYDTQLPRFLAQGPDGGLDHTGSDEYGYDFAMPTGTPVLAARSGKVTRVIDGFDVGGLSPEFRARANAVLVLHSDGTFAEYAHLRRGIALKPNEEISAGEVVGYSGASGTTAGPTLGLAVYRNRGRARLESVPLRFSLDLAAKSGFVPEQYTLTPDASQGNVELTAYAGEAEIVAGQPLALDPGAAVQLRVELAGEGDVTGDERTHFLAATPWRVSVDASGRVLASPTPAAEGAERLPEKSPAVVIVSYEDIVKNRYGYVSIPVRIGDE